MLTRHLLISIDSTNPFKQIRVGMSIGHSPDIDQHGPDMPKKAENVTTEDMQAARRRIDGSIASTGPESSEEEDLAAAVRQQATISQV